MADAGVGGRGAGPRRGTLFVVELRYREPGYEARHGAREAPYRFRYRVEAASAELALRQALADFRHIASISGVSWSRDVVGYDVTPVDAAGSAP